MNKLGHEVHLYPTDKNKKCHLPEDLKHLEKPDGLKNTIKYDCQIAYTAPPNWPGYFLSGNKNRFAIWAYEFNGKNILPPGFAKYHAYIDKILAPSNFCKEVFINSKIPEDKIVVIPHGINLEDYENKNKWPLKTNRKIKIGLPLGQLHSRKNIPGLLKAYFEAFSNKDDVCLVLKIQTQKQQEKTKKHQFDVDFYDVYNELKTKYKERGEVEIISEFIPDMAEFYNACDIIFTMSNCEGFCMPITEAIAANKLTIAPRYGGQLDFMNDENSILIEGKIVRAPRSYQYWSANPCAEMFEPSIENAVSKLRFAVKNYNLLIKKFKPNMEETARKFTWTNIVKQIEGLCK